MRAFASWQFPLGFLSPSGTPLTRGYSLRCCLVLTNSCFFPPLAWAEREVNRKGRGGTEKGGSSDRGWLRRKFGEELDVTAEKCLHYDRRDRSKDSGGAAVTIREEKRGFASFFPSLPPNKYCSTEPRGFTNWSVKINISSSSFSELEERECVPRCWSFYRTRAFAVKTIRGFHVHAASSDSWRSQP